MKKISGYIYIKVEKKLYIKYREIKKGYLYQGKRE